MQSIDTAKFALKTLAICANAHCGNPSLTAERLAKIFIGQAKRITAAEKKIVREILAQADAELIGRAMKEAGGEKDRVLDLARDLA